MQVDSQGYNLGDEPGFQLDDRRRIAACQYAGKHLKRYPAPPWSPELARLRTINCLLRLAIHIKLHPHEDCTDAMQVWESKLGFIGVDVPDSVEDCKKFRAENLKALRALEKSEMQTASNRHKHQESKIAAYTDAGNTAAADILKRIQRAEATSEVFKQCAAARGKTDAGGLSYVKVPVDPTRDPKDCTEKEDWRDVVEAKEVATAIRERLQKHFSQAKDCNLTSEPFDITMHFDAACDRAEAILTGTLDTSELDEMTTALLESFKHMLDGRVAVEPTLSEGEFLGKIKAWNERTSTSPHTNVHLGHAKAYIAQTTLAPNTPEYETFEKQRGAILHGHLVLLNYALQFGYSYDRWKKIVNAMLEKEPGNPKIHRLRVIHLYEWDFNLLLCVKWRQLLHQACDNRLINEACYGTMPGHGSLDPVFIREMEYEVSRLTRRPLVHFDNDATSCYDRIPCFLANLASRKYGMHHKVCIVQARTLAEAKYYLKTKLGISDEYAEHTQECPWFGTGQGSGNSPFYWLLISSTLYDLYCSKTTGGATYMTPNKQLQIQIHLLGFVDDVNNRTNISPEIPSENIDSQMHQLIEQANKDGQLWHDILTAANQELELTKCQYHVIRWGFQEATGKPYLADTPDAANPQLPPLVIEGKHQPIPIKSVPSTTAMKYLGCYKCPGNQKKQMAVLQAKCDDYARVIKCSHLSRRGTHVFYQAIYRLSMNYPLPVCYFNFRELDKIQRKAHRAMVAGCGFNRNTARAVLFGPAYLGGASFFHLYDEQGYGQVAYFMKSWRTPHSHAGQMLQVAVAWAQYSLGTGISFLQDTETALPHFESCWLASLRAYLHAIDGHLELNNPHVPPPQRQHDQHIMDIVLASGQFKPYQVRLVNYCRLYLRVITLADIANANGTHILHEIYHGYPTGINDNSNWCHVHQKRPGSKAWVQWRRFCRLVSQGRTTHLLDQPLGAWTVPAHQQRKQWQFWHDRDSKILYRREASGTFAGHPQLHFDFDAEAILHHVQALPAAAVPVDVTVEHRAGLYRMKAHYNQWNLPVPNPPPPSGLLDYFHSLEPWERSLFQGLQLLVPDEVFMEAIQAQSLFMGSDGSSQVSRASFGWILCTKHRDKLAICNGPSLGARPNSYRAEGYGLLSCTRFFHHLRTHFKLEVQECIIYCDNKAMVNRAGDIPKHIDHLYPNSTMDSEWDLLIEIWRTNVTIEAKLRPKFSWVKGHQDKDKPYEELPFNAQLNCDADALANAFIQQNPDMDYSKAHMLPTSGIQLHLPLGTVSNKYSRELRLARTTGPLKEYLKTRFEWDEATFNDIDWECSRRGYQWQRKHWSTLLKHANNITPVGCRVHRYDPKYPKACPSCPEEEETAQHLYQCAGPTRVELKNKILQQLRKTMTENDTPEPMMELMLEGLYAVLHNRDLDTIKIPAGMEAIAAAQRAIGWEHLLRGRLTKLWAQTQQQHLGSFDPKKNGTTWGTKIISALLQGWLDIWNLRNGDRHGRDAQSRHQAETAQAIRELEQLYELKGHILPEHEWLFAVPLDVRRSMKIYHVRAYINCWKPVLEESYKERLATG